MKRKWKIWLILIGVVVLAGGVIAGANYSKRGIVEVQTGRASRQDLSSIVTASGEIKPKNYINIGANAMGVITEILVKEGDRVRKGQLLAMLESVQPQADVNAQKATLDSAEADTTAAEASLKAADENLLSAQATVDRSKADLEQAKLDFDTWPATARRQADRQAGVRHPPHHLRIATGRRTRGRSPRLPRPRPSARRRTRRSPPPRSASLRHRRC